MTVLQIVEGLLVGGLTGFLSGLLGIGGGFLLVPLLSLIGLPMHTVVGTSLAAIACVGLAGVSQHARQGSIDFLMAGTLALPAAVMASVSARFLDFLSPTSLYFLFGSLTLAVLVFFHLYSQPDSPPGILSSGAHTTRLGVYQTPPSRHRHHLL